MPDVIHNCSETAELRRGTWEVTDLRSDPSKPYANRPFFS
jgi:hypothetical protein